MRAAEWGCHWWWNHCLWKDAPQLRRPDASVYKSKSWASVAFGLTKGIPVRKESLPPGDVRLGFMVQANVVVEPFYLGTEGDKATKKQTAGTACAAKLSMAMRERSLCLVVL